MIIVQYDSYTAGLECIHTPSDTQRNGKEARYKISDNMAYKNPTYIRYIISLINYITFAYNYGLLLSQNTTNSSKYLFSNNQR